MSNSFTTLWTVACQALLFTGLPRQEYWSETIREFEMLWGDGNKPEMNIWWSHFDVGFKMAPLHDTEEPAKWWPRRVSEQRGEPVLRLGQPSIRAIGGQKQNHGELESGGQCSVVEKDEGLSQVGPCIMCWMFMSLLTHPNSYADLTPKEMVLGGGAFRKWLGHGWSRHEWDEHSHQRLQKPS